MGKKRAQKKDIENKRAFDETWVREQTRARPSDCILFGLTFRLGASKPLRHTKQVAAKSEKSRTQNSEGHNFDSCIL
jgi:hypothetical protein